MPNKNKWTLNTRMIWYLPKDRVQVLYTANISFPFLEWKLLGMVWTKLHINVIGHINAQKRKRWVKKNWDKHKTSLTTGIAGDTKWSMRPTNNNTNQVTPWHTYSLSWRHVSCILNLHSAAAMVVHCHWCYGRSEGSLQLFKSNLFATRINIM